MLPIFRNVDSAATTMLRISAGVSGNRLLVEGATPEE
jgi:hypothetical protein